MKTLIKIFVAVMIIAGAIKPASAQESKADRDAAKIAAIKELIQSKNFVFKAEYVYPMDNTSQRILNQPGGNQRYLNNQYDVRISPDTVTSFLPYYGVAYFGAGYNSPDDSGIKFTSTKFDYKVTEKKKGSYVIYIRPKDAKYTNQLIFNIAANGSTNLSVQSVNRQSISFSGYIQEKAKPKS